MWNQAKEYIFLKGEGKEKKKPSYYLGTEQWSYVRNANCILYVLLLPVTPAAVVAGFGASRQLQNFPAQRALPSALPSSRNLPDVFFCCSLHEEVQARDSPSACHFRADRVVRFGKAGRLWRSQDVTTHPAQSCPRPTSMVIKKASQKPLLTGRAI